LPSEVSQLRLQLQLSCKYLHCVEVTVILIVTLFHQLHSIAMQNM